MTHDDDDEVPSLDEASKETQDTVRAALRAGRVDFDPQVIETLKEMGISEDEVIAMMRKTLGLYDS